MGDNAICSHGVFESACGTCATGEGAATAALDPFAILRDVHTLLRDGVHWVCGAYAVTDDGNTLADWYVDEYELEGVPWAFCLSGAIEFVAFARTGGYSHEANGAQRRAKALLETEIEHGSIIALNDHEGHAAVVAALEEVLT